LPNRWCGHGSLGAVTLSEGAALEHHPVLDGYRPAMTLDPFECFWRGGLCMIEEPANIKWGTFPCDLVEHIEKLSKGLVVCSVNPEAPVVVDQQPDCGLEIGNGLIRYHGSRFGEVLEINRGEDKRLSSAVRSKPAVALPGRDRGNPAPEVIECLAGSLWQKMVREAYGQLATIR
jgi:hypothetical protein